MCDQCFIFYIQAYRKPLESDHGDPFTLLNAFDEWIQVKAEGQGTKKWCRKRALEEQRFYEMVKLKNQFKDLLKVVTWYRSPKGSHLDYNLLNTNDDDSKKYLTSDERRKRHGERKRLTELKREKDRESKKRKVLKLEGDDFMISDDEEDDKDRDIRDLEFRLSHDLDKLQSNSNKNRSFTLRDINLLKIILCSGLYPQVATADQCNNYKRDSEQAFHTKSKPFLLLHPTSVFMCKPEVLMPPEIKDPPRCPSDLQGKLSKKHQLLAYLFLLETTKPYLMNVMRVPALQTITLFSNSIDTNADCTRLVCDGWLELRFADEESASQVISSIIHLRATWQNLLKLRLQDVFRSLDDDRRVNPRARKLEKVLASKLTEFLSSDVMYAVRRVYSAELWNMYKGPGSGIVEMESIKSLIKTPEETEAKEHPVKGGIQINDYMVYDCLLDDSSAAVWGEYTSHMQRHWQCPRCKQSLIVTVQERLLHESQCQDKNFQATKEEEAQEMEEEKSAQLNPLRKHYHCDKCDKDFKFTSTEILKHRKSHVDS
ncbi:hypothetical protein FSP39_008501 [Pinctada imbricata]|uniref:ATP-dependent RNA helicase DHX34 n=1 Tax=Pinctada imbricata TaxID=66713 RepID=A0AA89C088_PINIB|nr:hypothetical protein FSP39_008501 [Pinctada imbricata]